MDFLKSTAGKVVSGVVGLVVVAVAIMFWTMDATARERLVGGIFSGIGWVLLVAVAPWALFMIIGWVAGFRSNAISAVFVSLVTALEAVVLLWLFGWNPGTALGWVMVIGAVLVAGVYNVLASDWIADRGV